MYTFDFTPEEFEHYNAVLVMKDTDDIFIGDLVNMFEQFCLGLTFSKETIAKGFNEWLEENEYFISEEE